MPDRYAGSAWTSLSEDEWHQLAREALLSLLRAEGACTIVEMEAKLSDRTYDSFICPKPINPHHITTARQALADEGTIEPTTAPTKARDEQGNTVLVTTWSIAPSHGRKTAIARAGERKRALTARWYSWGRRHLLGRAGERALSAALEECETLAYATGSTTSVLGVEVPEIDNTAVYVDRDAGGLRPVQVVFEVKNTREHYYADDDDVLRFLAKAATIQAERPGQLVLPVLVCRQWQWTLWAEGEKHGFLPAKVTQQVVEKDPDISAEDWAARFAEVRDEMFPDLIALSNQRTTTNRHRGIVNRLIPKRAIAYATQWRTSHVSFLP